MRVLVTGGGGFIGSAVGWFLQSRGDEMVTFDHIDGHDVNDYSDIHEAIYNTDAVINLAGRLGTSETFGAELDTATVNIIGALNVADAARKLGKPMVQIGTGHKGQPNPYAITKACAEDLLLARASETGQPISVVRAYHAYGPKQKPFPPHGTSTVRKFIPSFICRALTGMPLEINGTGNQIVDPIYVDEVARMLVEAIDAPPGTFREAGCGKGITINAIAKDVIRMTGSSSRIDYIDKRQGEPLDAVVVAESPGSRLNWPYGMTETIDYYKHHLGQ